MGKYSIIEIICIFSVCKISLLLLGVKLIFDSIYWKTFIISIPEKITSKYQVVCLW